MSERDLFLAALDISDLDERARFLAEQCGPDAARRKRLEHLLLAKSAAGSFLDAPPQHSATAPFSVNDAEPTADYPGKDEYAGAVIAGKYTLVEPIGEGGMGSVWRAKQTEPVKRYVAVKLIKAGMDSKQVLARFEAERQALAMMDHPNIAKVLDGGVIASPAVATAGLCGRPYFVMELVKGIPITDYCDANKLTPQQRLELFLQVCQAIQHAHQKGIIHRDIKPSNVLIAMYDDKPVVKVIDFGVAKATGVSLTEKTIDTGFGAVVGTPQYMSPEQATFNNLDIDTRSDVYALGVLLYELLAGSTPFSSAELKQKGLFEILRVVREEEPPRPSVKLSTADARASLSANRGMDPKKLTGLLRNELDWIVVKALEKDRTRRYESANGFAADVQRYLAGEAVQAHPPTAGYRLKKFLRRNQGRVVGGGAFAAVMIVAIGLVVFSIWWTEQKAAERRFEQALTTTRNNDAFKAMLDQAETALKAGRNTEAGILLQQAGRQIDDQTAADLRERHHQLQIDEGIVRELNDIFEERWMISRSDIRLDNTRAKRRYPDLFQRYHLPVGREPAALSVERIRRSLIADILASSMAEWFFVDPKYPGLHAVLDLLDPDKGRASLRAAIAVDDNHRVREIGQMIDGSQLGPTYATGLATHASVRTDDQLRILKAAWRTHPDSFPLALAISSRSPNYNDKLAIEAVGWARIAIALRPENALSH